MNGRGYNMTYEEKLDLIQSYIDDIKNYNNDHELSANERQHVRRALQTYSNLFDEVERGKLDPDILHENITSFLYMLQ